MAYLAAHQENSKHTNFHIHCAWESTPDGLAMLQTRTSINKSETSRADAGFGYLAEHPGSWN